MAARGRSDLSLERVRRTWTTLGERDAFWAVLTGDQGQARQWDAEAFFRTGEWEIDAVLAEIDPPRGAALDFGCGLGRLTRALSQRFERAVGVDIAPSMIERARELTPQCEFIVNDAADLSRFPDATFDLVYSNITLQHMPPELSAGYIAEFFRVCRPGGAVVFQLPAEPVPRPPRRATSTLVRMPRKAFRARVQIESEGLRCAPGASFPLSFRVFNLSKVTWPALGNDVGDYSVRFGNHWRSARWPYRMLERDDARGAFEHDIEPGEDLEVGLNLVAPREPGEYLLEIDLVQELVSWFTKRWKRPSHIRVVVDATLPEGEVVGLPPRMEMHGIPRVEVEALIRAGGGEVVKVAEDDGPGPDWKSFRYYARRLG